MLRTSFTPVLLVVFLLSTAVSCAGGSGIPNLPPGEDPDRYTFVASDESRDPSPDVPPAIFDELVQGNTKFAFDVYKYLMAEDGNLFFSPFSISQALAMTLAGTRGNTEIEIADTMNFTLPQTELHPAFNLLDLELQSRGEGASGKDGLPFRLNIANSTWGQQGWTWLTPFLDTLAVNYGAGMRLVDFQTQPEECRVIINDWVSDRTEGRIPELLPEGMIDSMTALVLVNAIYFNASWAEPFDEEFTAPGDFTLLDDTKVTVPLMHGTEDLGYNEGDGWQACEMPYDGGELSMVIILPDEGTFGDFEQEMDEALLDEIVTGMGTFSVTITFPKFEYSSEFPLNQTLSDMGMVDAFVPGVANFSGMDGTRMLYITDVIHKAYVGVDEAGTEAAAATGVVIGFTSMPQPATFTADHPFIFLIRDIETEAILFLGRVINPSTP